MAFCELGIFARTFARNSIETNFDAVARHGLGVVQYNLTCAGLPSLPDRIPTPLARRIATSATACGVRIAAVSGTFNMIHPDVEQRRRGLHRLRVLASACANLGTRTISLCTGTRDPDDMWRGHPSNRDSAAWRDLLSSMEVAVSLAEEFDLVLGVEPEIANVVDSTDRAVRLLAELRSSRLKIILDGANLLHPCDLLSQPTILDEAFDRLGPHIIMAHAKDVRVRDGEIQHVAAGTGLLDYPHYLAHVQRVNAPLIVHGLAESEVSWSLAFLRSTHATVQRTCQTEVLRCQRFA